MKIATLGPEGTFSEEAVLKIDKKAEILFQHTIWDVFDAVSKKEAEQGVVPIENSLSGSVGNTFDALMEFDLQITKEVILPIKHCLAANTKLENVTQVYAHPQAYAQCENYIRKKLGNVEVIPTASNAASAQRLAKAKTENKAAIVPPLAGKNYGVKIMQENIQDNRFNTTRFVVIEEKETKATGNDRTSISIYPHTDKPGLLYTLIGEFAKRKINLSKIESRPSKGKLGDYVFFIDLQGHKDDTKVKEAFKEIEKDFFLKVLGSYPRVY